MKKKIHKKKKKKKKKKGKKTNYKRKFVTNDGFQCNGASRDYCSNGGGGSSMPFFSEFSQNAGMVYACDTMKSSETRNSKTCPSSNCKIVMSTTSAYSMDFDRYLVVFFYWCG